MRSPAAHVLEAFAEVANMDLVGQYGAAGSTKDMETKIGHDLDAKTMAMDTGISYLGTFAGSGTTEVLESAAVGADANLIGDFCVEGSIVGITKAVVINNLGAFARSGATEVLEARSRVQT